MLLNTHTLVAWRQLLPSISKSDYVYKYNCDKAPRKPKWQLSVSLLFISFLRHGSFIRQSCCYGRILSRFITSHCWWFKAADGLDIGVSVYNIGQFRNPDVSVWHLKTRMLPQWGQLWLYYTMDNAFPQMDQFPISVEDNLSTYRQHYMGSCWKYSDHILLIWHSYIQCLLVYDLLSFIEFWGSVVAPIY